MYETGYRHLVKIVFFLCMIPVSYWVIRSSVAYVTGPTLYEGDQVESRTCRECGGTGKSEDLENQLPELGGACPGCGGKCSVDVVIPGSKRPTRVWGAVVDLQAADETIAFSCPIGIKMLPLEGVFQPTGSRAIQGGIAGAALTFLRAGEESLVAKSDASGRFTHRLPPGSYTVKVDAPGFAPFEGTIEIEPLTAPIWMERAHIIRGLSEAESRSANGIALILAITKPGEGGAFVRLYALPM